MKQYTEQLNQKEQKLKQLIAIVEQKQKEFNSASNAVNDCIKNTFTEQTGLAIGTDIIYKGEKFKIERFSYPFRSFDIAIYARRYKKNGDITSGSTLLGHWSLNLGFSFNYDTI